jgi:hypothetical protein
MKYKSKDGAPAVIDAMKFIITREVPCKFGMHKDTNSMDIAEWMGRVVNVPTFPNGTPEGKLRLEIETPYGLMYVNIGDYVVRAYDDNYFPCVGEIFESEYELSDPSRVVPHNFIS